MKISLICPTRGRPRKMELMWNSALETADNPNNIEIAFYLDSDDDRGISKLKDMRSSQVKSRIGDRMPIENGANMWNLAYSAATGEILMLCADDVIFRSDGWDTTVLKEFETIDDNILYVCCNDKARYWRKWGTHGFLHQNWVKSLGYFAPPIYFYGVDDYYTWLAKCLGRIRWKDEIVIEHMNWKLKKTEEDIKKGADSTAQFRHRHFSICVQSMNKFKNQLPPDPGYFADLFKLVDFLREFYNEDERGAWTKKGKSLEQRVKNLRINREQAAMKKEKKDKRVTKVT